MTDIMAWNDDGTPIMLPEETSMSDVLSSIYLDKMMSDPGNKNFHTNMFIHGRLHRLKFTLEPVGFHETLQGTN